MTSNEVDDTTRATGRAALLGLSVAIAAAQALQSRRIDRAADALRADHTQRAQVAQKLHAEHTAARAAWTRARDRAWCIQNPRDVPDAVATAAAWAPVDRSAADTLRLLTERYPDATPAAALADRTDIHAAVGVLLTEPDPADNAVQGWRRRDLTSTERARVRQACDTVLTPAQNDAVSASPAMPTLGRALLDISADTGTDPEELLGRALTVRDLAGVNDLAAVLHHRVITDARSDPTRASFPGTVHDIQNTAGTTPTVGTEPDIDLEPTQTPGHDSHERGH